MSETFWSLDIFLRPENGKSPTQEQYPFMKNSFFCFQLRILGYPRLMYHQRHSWVVIVFKARLCNDLTMVFRYKLVNQWIQPRKIFYWPCVLVKLQAKKSERPNVSAFLFLSKWGNKNEISPSVGLSESQGVQDQSCCVTSQNMGHGSSRYQITFQYQMIRGPLNLYVGW